MIRLLILDDDAAFAHGLRERLARNTDLISEIAVAASAEEAKAIVARVEAPFDVFLIDQLLGPGLHGLEVLGELRQLSPKTEAILFSTVDEPGDPKKAFQIGVYRFLAKPFGARELEWILRGLDEQRRMRLERDWLHILTEVAEEAQRCQTEAEVAEVIVRGGQRLGFERVRLWTYSEAEQALIGLREVGNTGILGFEGLRMPIAETPYSQRILAKRDPVFFHGNESGTGFLSQEFGGLGFQHPIGEWAGIALWAQDRPIGTLALDNASLGRDLNPEQRSQLALFGRQAAAALERARLHERDTRQREEFQVLNEIGQRVAEVAASGNLDALLPAVHEQIGRLMDARSCMVILKDEDIGQLDVRFHVEQGQRQPRRWLPTSVGFVSHVIAHSEPVYLPDVAHLEAFCATHGIYRSGRPALCWMGVPLRAAGQIVGAIVVQSYEREQSFTEDDFQILQAVADQIAGAIQTARLAEQEKTHARQLDAIHHASIELMPLAEKNEDWLWRTVLTIATADYGLSFNRAMLFLAEEGADRLRGEMGVGHLERPKARRAWERDKRAALNFDRYLGRLRAGRLRATPVEEATRDLILDLGGDQDAFRQVLRTGQRLTLPADQSSARLPPIFVQRFGAADYALIPCAPATKL